MDVKSLFKSGKKTIKAFKVVSGPEETKPTEKSSDDHPEHWEAPIVVSASQAGIASNVITAASADLTDFKGEAGALNGDSSASKSAAVVWTTAKAEPVVEEKITKTESAYVPPSQRKAAAVSALPSLAEATKTSASFGGMQSSVAAPSTGAGAPRLKLITAASKKAQEEEARKKELEKKEKELEKLARKEQLKAEFERLNSASETQMVAENNSVKAASLSDIYAKYVGRAKVGRTLNVVA